MTCRPVAGWLLAGLVLVTLSPAPVWSQQVREQRVESRSTRSDIIARQRAEDRAIARRLQQRQYDGGPVGEPSRPIPPAPGSGSRVVPNR